MSVEVEADGTIALKGTCPSADAEALLQQLLASPEALVDWRACESAHTAVIQVLLAAKPKLWGPPQGGFLKERVEPLIEREAPGITST
jgi:hypothetical protein